MTPTEITFLAAAFFVVAVLYSIVGHGGGSGYLAVMALAGFAPETLRPTALTLNIVVAGVGVIRFARVGAVTWRLLWPFAAASVPAAFLAGRYLELDPAVYNRVVGVVLLFSAYRLFKYAATARDDLRPIPLAVGLGCGAAMGLLSGLVGVGGGIFLSPLVLLMGWATARQTAGVSAAFILVNSVSGLTGIVLASDNGLPIEPWPAAVFGAVVLAAGIIGSGIGSRRLGHASLRRVLAVVLLIAGAKMILP